MIRVLLFVIAIAALGVACEDDSTTPRVIIPCDEENPGGFSIFKPEPGRVYVWAGNGLPGLGEMGSEPGYTRLFWPMDVSFDPSGSPIVLDWNNHRVLALDANGKFEKLVGHEFGQPVDGPALETDLNHPTHICFSPEGTKLVLSAWHNSIVMEMDLATDWIARFCGTGGRCFNGNDQPRLASCLDLPVTALYHPISGELYISDQGNHVIRRVDASGVVHIVAGTAPVPSEIPGLWNRQFGYAGDGGPATGALLHFERGGAANPSGRICFDTVGNMYIADTVNHAIRMVTYPDGIIRTIAGKPVLGPGHSGDGGPAVEAQLNMPRDVAIDFDGTLFIADAGNHVVRKVAPDGTISTVVGARRDTHATPLTACELRAEHGAPARDVHLTAPQGIEIDADGNVWIADTQTNVIRVLYR